jgi:hypothetical protein
LVSGATLVVQNPANVANCVDEGLLGARIQEQLSAQSGASHKTPIRRLEVTISSGLDGLVANLRVLGVAEGMRRLEATHCQGLAEALAVTVAMILDSSDQALREPGPTPETSADVTREVAKEQPVAAPLAAQNNEAKRANQRQKRKAVDSREATEQGFSGIPLASNQQLRAWMGGGLGSWSTWNIESGLAFHTNHWGMALGAFFQPAKDHPAGNGKVRIMTLGGLVEGCLFYGSDWRALLCLRAMAGGERVRGIDYAREVDPRILPTFSLGPSLGIETGNHWIVGLALVGQVGLWRDAYRFDSQQDPMKMPLGTAWLVTRVAISSQRSKP